MKESEVKKAFEEVEPKAGAQERMYANILKKAAAQEAQAKEPETAAEIKVFPPKRRTDPSWRRWGSLAACFAVLLAASVVLPRVTHQGEGSEPPVMAGSPFEDVTGPEDFTGLGFTIDAPEGAEDVSYCIYDGEIARVDFTLDGHAYTYEAARLDGNFSRTEGEATESVSINAEYGGVLDRVDPDTWRAHWDRDGVSCYLTNFDGASEADITAAAQALMADF